MRTQGVGVLENNQQNGMERRVRSWTDVNAGDGSWTDVNAGDGGSLTISNRMEREGKVRSWTDVNVGDGGP
jgi:hypothetical protein